MRTLYKVFTLVAAIRRLDDPRACYIRGWKIRGFNLGGYVYMSIHSHEVTE